MTLFEQLGTTRNYLALPQELLEDCRENCWESAEKLDHLGIHVNTEAMRVYVSDRKIAKMRKLVSRVLLAAQSPRKLESAKQLWHFCRFAFLN